MRIAQERELVLAAPDARRLRLDILRVREPQPRLAQEVEADVGQRDVLLEDRPLADPLGQPLREHEAVVGEPQHVVERARSVDTSAASGRPSR